MLIFDLYCMKVYAFEKKIHLLRLWIWSKDDLMWIDGA